MKPVLAICLAMAAVAGCSKPTELASNKNAKGAITVAAAAPNTPPPAISAEELEAIAAEQGEPLPVDPNAAPPAGETGVSGPATVGEYRPSISGDIGALPPVGDAPALAAVFATWRARAASSPGVTEPGQVQLGANEQEYKPSDAELVAAEAGDRLSAALRGADDVTRAAVSAAVGGDPGYRRFDFRRVDVAGSGRFVYASNPQSANLPL